MPRLLITLVVVALVLTGCTLGPGSSEAKQYFGATDELDLAKAVAKGDKTTVAQLVADGADPNAKGAEELTMLQWSVMANSVDGMAALLDAGADPDLVGSGGEAPLHNAAFEVNLPLIELLLSAGADPNVKNAVTDRTPLTKACLQFSADVLTTLLEAGADPDAADKNGDGAIHTCSRTNSGGLLLLMLEHGADPRATNSGGASFQDYYFNYPPKNVLNERALAERVTIIQWLEDHDVPVIDAASQFR